MSTGILHQRPTHNKKGDVGKITTAANLSAGLLHVGIRPQDSDILETKGAHSSK